QILHWRKHAPGQSAPWQRRQHSRTARILYGQKHHGQAELHQGKPETGCYCG
ncbi:MAG: hypothetical protein H6Q15_2601, partial [Bacteroidetes bacterium]|nr:hypothetical protein [Bacteroidota bacterium]